MKRGDIYLADLSLGGNVIGSEQGGFRPVLIIQNDIGNRFSPTLIVAAITTQINKAKLPTHVEIGKEQGLERESVILMEQIRTIDKKRVKTFVTSLDNDVMEKVDRALDISLGRIRELQPA